MKHVLEQFKNFVYKMLEPVQFMYKPTRQRDICEDAVQFAFLCKFHMQQALRVHTHEAHFICCSIKTYLGKTSSELGPRRAEPIWFGEITLCKIKSQRGFSLDCSSSRVDDANVIPKSSGRSSSIGSTGFIPLPRWTLEKSRVPTCFKVVWIGKQIGFC